MSYYESEAVKDTEEMALKLLKEIDIECSASNMHVKTDVDITTAAGKKIDVQYSNNFAKYGDFRVDIISAYTPLYTKIDTSYTYNKNINIIENFKKKYNCKVIKEGKIYQKDYVDYLIVFFYDNKYKERVTEKILIIKIAELHNYINNNAAALFEQIKINDKNRYNLSDKHGSAFLPIDVCCLKKDCKCFFDTWEKLCKQKENIKNYIY